MAGVGWVEVAKQVVSISIVACGQRRFSHGQKHTLLNASDLQPAPPEEHHVELLPHKHWPGPGLQFQYEDGV